MLFPKFALCFDELKSKGFTIQHAEYWDAFGSWLIEFSSKTTRPHRLVWDGHERWLVLQCERPQSEQKPPISPEALRQMSYEDGVIAQVSRKENAWKDKWIGHEEAEWSVDRAMEHLRS